MRIGSSLVWIAIGVVLKFAGDDVGQRDQPQTS